MNDPLELSRRFDLPPAPLTRKERLVFAWLSIIIGLTRLLAVAKTLWDWDEANFVQALDDFNVTIHHPHPPGSPVFVFLGKIVSLVVSDHFRALQTVSVLAAFFLFPVAFLLLRELRVRFAPAIGGAAILAFLPNVWFYGGTAFSDLTGLTLILLANTILLRGVRNRRDYFLGTVLLAFTMGMRPQMFLAGMAIGLVASWYRRRRPLDIVIAAFLGALIIVIAYGAAAQASGGWTPYKTQLDLVSQYVAKVDAYTAEGRPPLRDLFEKYFVNPYDYRPFNLTMTALAILSLAVVLIRRRWNILLIAATFLPLAIASWLLLDLNSISRYSVAYMAMHAFLAADGLWLLTGVLRKKDWARRSAFIFLVLVLLFFPIRFTLKALKPVRNLESPPYAAMKWIMANSSTGDLVNLHGGIIPQGDLMLVGRERNRGGKIRPPGPGRKAFYVAEGVTEDPAAKEFSRGRGNLYRIARQRFFEVYVLPLDAAPLYLEGWYDPEEIGKDVWRWMGTKASIQLPPKAHGGVLRLELSAPLNNLAASPTVIVRTPAMTLDSFVMREINATRLIEVPPSTEPVIVTIETNQTFNPKTKGLSDDGRDLGLQAQTVQWLDSSRSLPKVTFQSGWYGVEGTPPVTWQWSQGKATAQLSHLDGPGTLRFDAAPPRNPARSDPPSHVVITVNGVETRLTLETRLSRNIEVPATAGPIDVTIETDRVVSPSKLGVSADTRDLGLQVFALEWRRR